MAEKLFFKVPDKYDNVKAINFLKGECKLSSRMITLLKREKNGILMDGKILRTIDFVYSGKTVEINLPDEELSLIEPVCGNLDIVYEDEHILAVNKPANMPVHPVKQHRTDTLANIVAYYQDENKQNFVFRAINRLDRDTSGIVIIAKNKYSSNLLKNKVDKTYYAICHGKLTGEGTINEPIKLRDDSKMVRTISSDGLPSVTHYKSIAFNDKMSLIKLHLETGRTHQIRCHMAYLGHPLIGDDLYGGTLEYLPRQALHCKYVSFLHPINKRLIELDISFPEDMKNLILQQKLLDI